MAIFDAYISFRAGYMISKNGHLTKELVLYPLAQPFVEHDLPLWVEEEEEEFFYQSSPYLVCALDVTHTPTFTHFYKPSKVNMS